MKLMNSKLQESLSKLMTEPLALSEKGIIQLSVGLENLRDYLSADIDEEMFTEGYTPRPIEDLEYNADTGVGVLNVSGLLVDKYDWYLSYFFGATSYEELVADTRTMLEAGAHTIIQYNDSGGGQAYGVFQSSNEVKDMVKAAGAKMIAYSDGITASAAYAWASVSDEIIANPDSEVGSVGVVIRLTDISKYLENEGIKPIYITAGEGKVPYNKDGSFKDEFLQELQSKVDSTYSKFKSHVTANRPMTDEQLTGYGAAVFSAQEAQDKGYIDAQMDRTEFFTYISEISYKKNSKNMNFLKNLIKPTASQDTVNTPTEGEEMSFTQEQLDTAISEAQSLAKAGFEAELSAALEQSKQEYEAKLSAKDTELSALKEQFAAAEKAKQEAKEAQRVKELAAVVGDAKAAKLASTLKDLDDEAFAETVGTFTAAKADKDKEFLKEIGEEGAEVEVTITPAKNTAKSLAKQFKKQ